MLSLVTNKETQAIKIVSNFIEDELEKLQEFFGNWFIPDKNMIKHTGRRRGYVWIGADIINTMFEETAPQHKIRLTFRIKNDALELLLITNTNEIVYREANNALELLLITNTNEIVYREANEYHLACCLMGGAC